MRLYLLHESIIDIIIVAFYDDRGVIDLDISS